MDRQMEKVLQYIKGVPVSEEKVDYGTFKHRAMKRDQAGASIRAQAKVQA